MQSGSVLVIDAGELNDDPSILIPYDTLNYHPDRFYKLTSQPIRGLNNITYSVLAGAVVGGGYVFSFTCLFFSHEISRSNFDVDLR